MARGFSLCSPATSRLVLQIRCLLTETLLAKYLVFIGLILFAFVVGPYFLLGMPDTATGYGIAMVSAGSAGTAIAALMIGSLGLLYKPNRFAGFVVGTLVATALMFAGANAQTICQFDGGSVKLCEVPDGWHAATPRAHASAEFSRGDGFFAQLIIDSAGSDQGLMLAAAADAVVRNMQVSVGEQSFELLMRGTNTGIRDSEIIVYQARIEGIPFIYANTIYVGRNQTIQMVTWCISEELTVDDRSAHLDFGRGLVLMPSF